MGFKYRVIEQDGGTANTVPADFEKGTPSAVLFVVCEDDRLPDTGNGYLVRRSATVGRCAPMEILLRCPSVSSYHFELNIGYDKDIIADNDSLNGTYVDGRRVEGLHRLGSPALIRAGRSLLVFIKEGEALLDKPQGHTFDMAGDFHTPLIVGELKKVARTESHVLLAGPSGAGKELAARAFAALAGRELVVHNAARYGTEDEAAATLFGVAQGVFTGVEPRTGLIERANGKALFLDEAHNYPRRIQKSLLRAMEENKVSRIGRNDETSVDVRYILAANEPPPDHGLAHDLLARLRVIEIPSLAERMADIPSLFIHLAKKALGKAGVAEEEVPPLFEVNHFESLCLDGFPRDNIRGLSRVAEEVAEEILDGLAPRGAVKKVFGRRYGNGPVARRGRAESAPRPRGERNTEPAARDKDEEIAKKTNMDLATLNLIRETYHSHHGVVAEIAKHLKTAHGIRLSRRRIAKVLDLLKYPRRKKRRS